MFLKRKIKKPTVALGLDIGSSQIKAALVKREEANLSLAGFAVRSVPFVAGRSGSESLLADELRQLVDELGVQDRRAYVAISCPSAMVCHADFPRMPLDEVKSALKINSARYLRRDLSNYYLDVAELAADGAGDDSSKKNQQIKVLVGGADKDEVQIYRNALVSAKIKPEVIELAAVSVVNAFQAACPVQSDDEVVLLLDVGAQCSSINFLLNGVPLITRIMHFGGYQLSEYIAQMLTLEMTAAEEEKRQMSDPVQSLIRTAISPLAREVRSSIDFFERQHERHVVRGFACGGSACSATMLGILSETVGFPIERWDPAHNFITSGLNGHREQLPSVAPSLAVAIGAAVARL
jgi:type IV pilus assembly protein PilM